METLLNVEDEVQSALNELEIFDKLERMEDFMNQNDLKVSITNENAVTTGLVTYTCTVKDQDNNALKNKVVEWYKGTTLLGMDATDANGVSTFSHRVTEADIYDVHAVVRGTHAGDDIRMFVKDKSNLLSFNLWSGSDYNKNTADTWGFVSSSDISFNGDYSFKIDSTSSVSCGINALTGTFEENETYNLTFKCKVGHSQLNVFFAGKSGTTTVKQTSVTIPGSLNVGEDGWYSITLPLTLTGNCDSFKVYVDATGKGISYLDELSIKV